MYGSPPLRLFCLIIMACQSSESALILHGFAWRCSISMLFRLHSCNAVLQLRLIQGRRIFLLSLLLFFKVGGMFRRVLCLFGEYCVSSESTWVLLVWLCWMSSCSGSPEWVTLPALIGSVSYGTKTMWCDTLRVIQLAGSSLPNQDPEVFCHVVGGAMFCTRVCFLTWS